MLWVCVKKVTTNSELKNYLQQTFRWQYIFIVFRIILSHNLSKCLKDFVIFQVAESAKNQSVVDSDFYSVKRQVRRRVI